MNKSKSLLNLFTFVVVLFTALSCKKDDAATSPVTSTKFIINNKEEKMPVWVEGNTDASFIILAVHGGPGSDVLDFRNYQDGTGFKELEKSYLVAYWQQRASGQSTGSDNNAYFTVNQYVEDCDKVVDELINRYPNKKIVLLGHSWGGMLTAAYLGNATRQAKITAWIDAAGAHNGTILHESTKTDLINEANLRIGKKENIEDWQYVKDLTQSGSENINALAYRVVDIIPEVTVKVNGDDFAFTKRGTNANAILFKEIITKDYSSLLATNFKKPVLFLWGKYDFAVSKKLRDSLIPKLSANKVTNISFDISGHYMMFHEPTKFANTIISFIKTL